MIEVHIISHITGSVSRYLYVEDLSTLTLCGVTKTVYYAAQGNITKLDTAGRKTKTVFTDLTDQPTKMVFDAWKRYR